MPKTPFLLTKQYNSNLKTVPEDYNPRWEIGYPNKGRKVKLFPLVLDETADKYDDN